MKHYYHPMSRAVSTYWMLLELGVEFEQVPVDFMAGENLQREFTSINPMAKIPTLVDGGVVVTEAAAICAYLADKFPEEKLAPPLDSTIRGAYYRYMIYPSATLEPMFTFQQMEVKDYSPQSVGWGDLERCLATIESMTPEFDWALGKDFTAADIVFGGTLDFAAQFNWIEPSEKVMAYIKRLKQRPAYLESHDESWH